jgi:glutathione S-transferase
MERADDLVLYMFEGCPYCHRVQAALKTIGVDVELRDIHADPIHRQALIDALGRKTVPVLRIDGDPVQWMPESARIVDYLKERYSIAHLPFSNPGLERLLLLGALFALIRGLGQPPETMWAGVGGGLILFALSEAWRAWRWGSIAPRVSAGVLGIGGVVGLLVG